MKKIKRIISFFLVIALLSGLSIMPSARTADRVGSLLDSYTPDTAGVFTLTSSSRIYIISDTAPDDSILKTASLIARQAGTHFVFDGETPETVYGTEETAEKGDIILHLDENSSLADEGYMLDVSDKAVITAKDERGLIYGFGTLMKILSDSSSVARFTAQDEPDTKERTVMLDCGRKYFTAEWIMNFIRQISWMGYNTLELHFSEDGGFRADFWEKNCYGDANSDGIPYSPVNDFSWLCGSHVQSWVRTLTEMTPIRTNI